MAIQDDTNYTLTGAQIKDLASRIVSIAENSAQAPLVGGEAPTPTTEGEVGRLYVQEDGTVYILKDIIIEPGEPNEYIWEPLGDSAKVGQSDPTTSTEGKVGDVYINTDTDEVFVLTHIIEEQGSPNEYTWTSLDSPIQSISVNGTVVTPDVNKNVDLTIDENEVFVLTQTSTTNTGVSFNKTAKQVISAIDSGKTILYVDHRADGEIYAVLGVSGSQESVTRYLTGLGADGKNSSAKGLWQIRIAINNNNIPDSATLTRSTLEYVLNSTPVDNLNSTLAREVLSANQGRVLKGLIDALNTAFTGTDGTTAGTQGLVPAPAMTDAGKFLKSDGTWGEAGGGITELTTADYDYPINNPDGVRLWAKPTGIYSLAPGIKVYGANNHNMTMPSTGGLGLVFNLGEIQYKYVYYGGTGRLIFLSVNRLGNFSENITVPITTSGPMAYREDRALSVGAGYVLQQAIGDLSTLTTTAKGSTVAAINELDSELDSTKPLSGSTAPTTSTEGTLGQTYVDTSTGDIYYLSEIDETTDPDTYTWEKLSTGTGVNVVQTTGTSTTDVMSQDAVTSMVYQANNKRRIAIGEAAQTYADETIAIGSSAKANASGSLGAIQIGRGYAYGRQQICVGYCSGSDSGNFSYVISPGSVLIGAFTKTTENIQGAIALGYSSKATQTGEMNIGSTNTSYGYNNSAYRLLTGLYDPQSDHDAATKGYVDNAVASVSSSIINGGTTLPTSSTEGQVGTQYNCVNNGEPEIYICTAVDTSTTPNTYTWKKVGLTLQLSTTDPGEGSPLADNTLLGIYE